MGALDNPLIIIGILLLALVLFGRGRVASMGGELGTAIREFKRGLNGEDASAKTEKLPTEEDAKKSV
jgi:sec-independent protein translocase protein TatA